jgi:hypothetical protein
MDWDPPSDARVVPHMLDMSGSTVRLIVHRKMCTDWNGSFLLKTRASSFSVGGCGRTRTAGVHECSAVYGSTRMIAKDHVTSMSQCPEGSNPYLWTIVLHPPLDNVFRTVIVHTVL